MSTLLALLCGYLVFLVIFFRQLFLKPFRRWRKIGEFSIKPQALIATHAGTVKLWHTARASSAMIPELEPHVRDGTSIIITGSGGAYLKESDGYHRALLSWSP